MKITTRPSTEADREFCYAAIKASDIRFVDPGQSWNEERQRRIFNEIYSKTTSDIIEADGIRAGFGYIQENADTVDITELHLDPSMCGKGIGTVYIRDIIKRSAGKTVIIETFKRNIGAKRLYERLGFKKIGESERHIRFSMPGGTLPEFDVVAAGNAFMEAGAACFKKKINREGITVLQNGSTAAFYFRACESGEIKISLRCKASSSERHITFSIGETEKNALIHSFSTISDEITYTIADKGYIRVAITCPEDIEKITALHISGIMADGFVRDYDTDNYYWTRRGPSVHLGYQIKEKNIEWFYNELTVPEGCDIIGTYAMAIGFSGGYFGIQVNGIHERRVLFSVWSPHVTDDPTTVPDELRVRLLYKNKRVSAQDFGGEGSGGQSYMKYNWKAGQTYKFLLHAVPLNDAAQTTVFTAYIYNPESSEWEVVASFARPKTGLWLEHLHSFLENFADINGYMTRRAEFSNAWAVTSDKEFIKADKAMLTADATFTAGNRYDGDGGVCPRGFFLQNGGYFNSYAKLRTVYQNNGVFKKPELDFSALKALTE